MKFKNYNCKLLLPDKWDEKITFNMAPENENSNIFIKLDSIYSISKTSNQGLAQSILKLKFFFWNLEWIN